MYDDTECLEHDYVVESHRLWFKRYYAIRCRSCYYRFNLGTQSIFKRRKK